MAFQIYQEPSRLTPANAEHIYNIGSDLSGENSYKFVVNVVALPYTWTLPEEKYIIAKIKARPNSEGRLIFDAQEIIQSMMTPNVRVDWGSYLETDIKMYRGGQAYNEDSYMVSKPTLDEAFSRINGNNSTDNFPPFGADPGLEAQYHVMDYRVMIGEEYVDSEGNLVSNGPDSRAKYVPATTENVYPSPTPGVTNDDIFWEGFNGRYNLGTLSGINYKHYSGGVLVEDRDDSSEDDNTNPFNLPVLVGDINIVTSLYSGKQWNFIWTSIPAEGEYPAYEAWVLSEITYNLPYTYGQFMPDSILTWVGAETDIQTDKWIPSTINEQNINGHKYDSSKWFMRNKEAGTNKGPKYGQFLNIAGPTEIVTYDEWAGATETVDLPTRMRSIYVGEPLMVSFFNGFCFDFINDLRVLNVTKIPTAFPTWRHTDYEYIIQDYGAGPLFQVDDPYPGIYDENELTNTLLHFTSNQIWSDGGLNYLEVPFTDILVSTWQYRQDPIGPIIGSPADMSASASEILHFKVKDIKCFNNPTFFVFLNRNGVWDTFTFGAKSVLDYDIDRKTYSKAPYRDSSIYNKSSFTKSNVVYENNITVGLTAETEYLEQYDSVIVEDLIRSSEVYIIQGNRGEGELSPVLLSVTIKTSKVEEYQKRYEKLFQHTIEVEFNNIDGFNQSI